MNNKIVSLVLFLPAVVLAQPAPGNAPVMPQGTPNIPAPIAGNPDVANKAATALKNARSQKSTDLGKSKTSTTSKNCNVDSNHSWCITYF